MGQSHGDSQSPAFPNRGKSSLTRTAARWLNPTTIPALPLPQSIQDWREKTWRKEAKTPNGRRAWGREHDKIATPAEKFRNSGDGQPEVRVEPQDRAAARSDRRFSLDSRGHQKRNSKPLSAAKLSPGKTALIQGCLIFTRTRWGPDQGAMDFAGRRSSQHHRWTFKRRRICSAPKSCKTRFKSSDRAFRAYRSGRIVRQPAPRNETTAA